MRLSLVNRSHVYISMYPLRAVGNSRACYIYISAYMWEREREAGHNWRMKTFAGFPRRVFCALARAGGRGTWYRSRNFLESTLVLHTQSSPPHGSTELISVRERYVRIRHSLLAHIYIRTRLLLRVFVYVCAKMSLLISDEKFMHAAWDRSDETVF